ncbi:MAG: hypothetical protein P1Q69_13340 [Candidatus Thorarchaeota archaeon]|nr:hypothetical protein [Candidatus Thorarchaeota archaeon]
MKQKKILILTIICVMVLGNVLPLMNEPASTIHDIKETSIPQLAQDFNISSYLEFSKATMDLIIDNLYNDTDGSIWRSADYRWEIIDLLPGLADYYWAIAAMARMYEASVIEGTPNTTLSTLITNAANRMVFNFLDDEYPGYGVNLFSAYELKTTKRPGIQSYAYQALRIAEEVNPALNFTEEKQSAITCLADILYDDVNGGLYFYTLRNGSLTVPSNFDEVYPNDGKRLDHLALGAMTLYDAGQEQSNSTLIAMANSSMSFLVRYMKESFQTYYYGLKLAVNKTGGDVSVAAGRRPGNVVVSDINAVAVRALLKAYNVTGNSTYLTLAESIFEALMEFNWDDEFGGWFAETLDGLPFDPLDDEDVKLYKYSEIQFQFIITLEQLYEITGNLFYIRTTIDVLDQILGNLWDAEYGGFYQNGNGEWASFSQDWQWHHTAVQGLGILAMERIWIYGLPILSNVRINPVSPRPTDQVLVSATAQDSDGIDMVYVNYTSNLGGKVTTGVIELLPNPEVGGVYNSTFGLLNDTAQVNFFVTANDTTGYSFIVGVYYFVVRADTFEPLIELRMIYPDEVRAGDVMRIEIGTYEFPLHSATLYCTLYWKLNNGPYTPVNLTLVGNDENNLIWQIDLGPFVGGDVISYYCIAEDEAGNSGTSPFYRITVLGEVDYVSPLAVWQLGAVIFLISAPGAGVAYVWSRSRNAREQQRILKKEARKRGRRGRGRSRSQSRSKSDTNGGN